MPRSQARGRRSLCLPAVAASRETRRAAGVAEAEQPRDLVEGLAGGVVAGAAEAAVAAVGLHQQQLGVAAGDDERERGQRRLLLGQQPVGADVALDVVGGDEGEAAREGDAAGGVEADDERAGEAGAGGGRDGVDAVPAGLGVGQRLADDGDERAQVLAGGDLRDDAAGGGVQLLLGGDDVRGGAAAVDDDGGGGLVAGGLDGEDGGHAIRIAGVAGTCPMPEPSPPLTPRPPLPWRGEGETEGVVVRVPPVSG